MKKLLFICGPTAVGKTEIAHSIAREHNAIIISADSRQIYRHMDIGTAKPSLDELNRYDYRFINIVNPNEKYSAGIFESEAQHIVTENFAKEKNIIVAGGSGFYIKALSEGLNTMPDIPPEIRENLTNELNEKGIGFLYEKLLSLDRAYGEKLHPTDTNRIIRALEVAIHTGKSLLDFQNTPLPQKPFEPIIVGLSMDREKLYGKINKRVDIMMESGLYREFQKLIDMGYTENDPGMKSVGYAEFFRYKDRAVSLKDAIEKIKQHTRNYAKRQMTWFRRNEAIKWFDMEKERKDIIHYINELNLFS